MSYDTRPRDNTDQPQPVESRDEHEVFEETRSDEPEATPVETEPETEDRAAVQDEALVSEEAPIHAETGDTIDDQIVTDPPAEEVSSEALVTDESIADEPVAEAEPTTEPDEPAAEAVAASDEPAAEADEPAAQADEAVADELVADADAPAAEAVAASDELAASDEPASVADELAASDEPVASADEAAAADAFAASDEAVAQADDSVAEEESATTLWPQDAISDLRTRWQAVQLRFVDDPPAVAAEMQVLVGEAVQALSAVVADRQRELDNWTEGSDTEQLRIAAQRYRDFFDFVLGR